MVLLAPLIQHGATLISALSVLLTVSVGAVPGSLVVLREYARMLDFTARGNMAILNTARNVDRYKRMLKQSVDSALVLHGYVVASLDYICMLTSSSLPPAQYRSDRLTADPAADSLRQVRLRSPWWSLQFKGL